MTRDNGDTITVHTVPGGLTLEALEARVFAGDVLAFEGLSAAHALRDHAWQTLCAALAPHDPLQIHSVLPDPGELKSRLMAVRRGFADDPTANAAWEEALAAAGCDPTDTYHDRFILRANAPQPAFERDTRMVLPPHRDTWGSGLLGQINWWMPINPLDAGRTMILYPDAFARTVANDSAGWDWRSAGKNGVPRLPSVLDAGADLGRPVPLIVKPGTLVAFSGAHLHATAVNRTEAPRFSTDTRTISRGAMATGRGAPDVDHGPVPPALNWFRRIGDGAPLAGL